MCEYKIRNEALPQLDSAYKNLFTLNQKKSFFGSMLDAIGSAFESVEYKQLKECFKYGRPVDRNLFDTALSKITNVYPLLYDKMAQGWSPEQIHEDLNKYADLINKKWNAICKDVFTIACLPIFHQLNMSGDGNQPTEQIHKGLVFYIQKMADDPYCTLANAMEAYSEQLRIEEEERIERNRQNQETLEEWSESFRERRQNSSSGGFLSNMLSTAGGVALGNKMSNSRGKKSGKLDLYGTARCPYGKKDDGGWTIACDLRCPFHRDCIGRH